MKYLVDDREVFLPNDVINDKNQMLNELGYLSNSNCGVEKETAAASVSDSQHCRTRGDRIIKSPSE